MVSLLRDIQSPESNHEEASPTHFEAQSTEWTIVFENVNGMKIKERLGNCSCLELENSLPGVILKWTHCFNTWV